MNTIIAQSRLKYLCLKNNSLKNVIKARTLNINKECNNKRVLRYSFPLLLAGIGYFAVGNINSNPYPYEEKRQTLCFKPLIKKEVQNIEEQKERSPEDYIIPHDNDTSKYLISNDGITVKPSGTYTVREELTNPIKIANIFGISYFRLKRANPNLDLNYVLPEGTPLIIPERYFINEDSVKNFEDVVKVTQIDGHYIKDILIGIEGRKSKPDTVAYYDGVPNKKWPQGCPTIGFGHTNLVDGKPIVPGETIITEEKSFALLAQDIINAKLDAITYMGYDDFNAAPMSIQTGIIDIVFNKGDAPFYRDGSPTSNLKKNLEDKDYVSAASNTILATGVKGLKKRNIYRVIISTGSLSDKERKKVLRNIKSEYRKTLRLYKNRIKDKEQLEAAWNNAQNGKTYDFFD